MTGSPCHPVIGITGGLATGKSLVTQLLREHGATVFSADEAARAILSPGGRVLREIVQAFGPDVTTPEGGLDRVRLGSLIFADPQARRKLDAIMHPPILRLLRAQIEAAQQDLPAGTVVAVEVPLLFETNLEDWFDRILVVSASQSVQVARLCARNGLEAEEAHRRLAAQWPMEDKIARADDVIVNDGTIEDVTHAVDALWRSWRRLAEPLAS